MQLFFECLISSLWLPIALNNFLTMKIGKKRRLLCGCLICVVMLISCTIENEITLVIDFLLFVGIVYVTIRCSWVNFIYIPISYVLVVVCNYLVEVLFISIGNFETEQILKQMPYVFYLYLVITILVAISSLFLGKVLKYAQNLLGSKAPKEMLCLIGVNIILCTIIFLINGWAARQAGYSETILWTNFILFITYAVLTMIISLILFKVFQKREEMEHQKKQYESLQEYTEQIETMYTNLRTFKHDYVNILVSLSGYFELKDYEGMEKYFNENILPTNQQLNRENYRLSQLSNIKEQALKGLLSSKLIYAHEIGIDVYIDIMDEIDRIHMNMIDLTRIMGIYLDNAIEAAQECEKKEIKLNIIKGEKSVTFIIVNTFVNQGDSLQQIEQYAYSTKGKNRGIGLHNVNQLVNKYENVFKETEMERGYFIQKLRIEER